MPRRPQPERIDEARRAALASRLTAAGVAPDHVKAWLAAWAAFAEQAGIDRDRDYWTRAWTWINAERDAGRRP